MNRVKLGEIANYSDTRVSISSLTVENYVGTDNLLQSKQGKVNSDYLLDNGQTTEYVENDILIANIRPYLKKIWFAKNNGGSSADVLTIRIKDEKYLPKFVYYNLFQDSFFDYAMKGSKGSKMPRGDKKQILNFPISDFDFQTQTTIANTLSSLDNKIELNNKINREFENLARTIYEYWFVQNAGKSWERKKIGDLIQSQKNGDWGKETEEGNYAQKVTCIRGADINSLVGSGELKAPERYILEKNKNKFLSDGDFVIEISGGSPTQSTGRIAYILDEMLKGFENPLICSNFCKAISLKDKVLFYYFIFVWRQLYDNGLFFGYEGKTSGIKNFLFDDFVNSYEVAIPPTELLEKFNKTVSPIFEQIIKNRQENTELARLRDFLLPLLMNGQVTVKATDIATELKKEKIVMLKPTNVDYYKRSLLAAEIVWQLHKEPTLGHLKLQKLIYLCQKSTDMLIPTNFLRQAMGPYDNHLMRSIDKQLKEKKWFEYQRDNYLKYQPLEKAGQHHNDFLQYFSAESESIQFIIDTFKKIKSDTVEIVATLYACLENMLSERVIFSEALLIQRFYEWSEEKAKFSESDVRQIFSRMKKKGIVPKEYNFTI